MAKVSFTLILKYFITIMLTYFKFRHYVQITPVALQKPIQKHQDVQVKKSLLYYMRVYG